MPRKKKDREFAPLDIAVLTVTDHRTEGTDDAGGLLADRLTAAGHRLVDKQIVPHNIYELRAVISRWIADPGIQAIICNGGTGLMGHNTTPEAVEPLLDKPIEGFGELFRWLSYEDIKTSTVASRAVAGVANGTIFFALPGSPNACRLGWDEIIQPQLDQRQRPCNLAELLPRLVERGVGR